MTRRTLRAVTPYFVRSVNRRKELVLSEKPSVLRHLGSLHKKVWRQYQTVLKRDRTPVEEAEFYARQIESRGLKSLAALAGLLNVPPNRVSRHLQLLKLAEPIRKFLSEHHQPEYLRYFTERRLGELVRLDARAAWRRFQEMIREAEREAGIWRNEAQ